MAYNEEVERLKKEVQKLKEHNEERRQREAESVVNTDAEAWQTLTDILDGKNKEG